MRLSEMSNNDNSFEKTTEKVSQNQKNITQTYEQLKGCSSDELMGMLAKEINLQKANGTFDYEGLLVSIEQIKMYLPTQTYENMLRIIENLKWI